MNDSELQNFIKILKFQQEVDYSLEERKKSEGIRFFYTEYKPLHTVQYEWHLNNKRNKWALGGNRTGKTVGGAMQAVLYSLGKDVEKYIYEWPESVKLLYKEVYSRFDNYHGCVEGWVVSLSNEMQRDVAQKEILKWLPKFEIEDIVVRAGRKDDPETATLDFIKLKNGNMIGFKSCEQGRAKFQGTSKNWIWFDEEPTKEIYDECLMRTLDVRGFIFGTMTPLMGLTFVYDDIYMNATKPINKQDSEIHCAQWSWDDNPFLSDEEKERLEKSLDPADLESRKRGQFVMPGKCTFDKLALLEMQDKCRDGTRGNLIKEAKTVRFDKDDTGEYEIWFHPDKSSEYIIGGDVAEGLEHGDYSAVIVLNRECMRMDAVYHGHCDPDVLADKMELLSIYYNYALLAPECNKDGKVTMAALKRKKDLTIFKSLVYDKDTNEERQVLGWVTSSRTRPFLVAAIKAAVRNRLFVCYWRRFIDEAMSWVRHSDGKEAARVGFWDDVIIACGIAVHLHEVTAIMKNLPEPGFGGVGLGIQPSLSVNNFIHPSIIEDMENEKWDNNDDDW